MSALGLQRASAFRFLPGAIYLVTDPGFGSRDQLIDAVHQAVRHGVSLVQVRDKEASTRDLIALTSTLVTTLPVPVIVNDRVDVCLAAKAAGVHVGQSDMPAAMAREILGPDAIVGISIETLADLNDSESVAAASYLATSPVFATATKTDTAPPLGLEGVSAIARRSSLPVVAIGGIHAENLASVFSAGAQAAAVVSAILGANDVATATAALTTCSDSYDLGATS